MADTDTKPAEEFDLVIVDPDQTIHEGKAKKLIAPGHTQEIAVLPDHTPLYSQLQKGQVVVTTNRDEEKTFDIEGGLIRVKRNKVSLIVGFN